MAISDWFNDRRNQSANKRALKAANKGSMANPKRQIESVRNSSERSAVHLDAQLSQSPMESRKTRYAKATKRVEEGKSQWQ